MTDAYKTSGGSPPRKFTLPISPAYVAHWTLWEAVRELYQNALDAHTADRECASSINYENGSGTLVVRSSKGRLTPSTLILGNTSKSDDPRQRGKFGEGYKLSLLVLTRLGHPVEIWNENELWTPRIGHDDQFDSDVLTVEIESLNPPSEGITFRVRGVTGADWKAIQRNINPIATRDAILPENDEVGRIYVGGLFTMIAKGFKSGYAFAPESIKLDRDRGVIDGFDLAYATSQLWTAEQSDRAVQLLKEEAPDVAYVESHAHKTSPLVSYHSDSFYRNYGNAVPVSNQEEVQKAVAAGVKWVLVPEPVKTLLRLVRSWFIPSSKSPAEQLRDFRKKYEWHMTSEMKHDLDGIIQTMDPQVIQTKETA